jgi:hypothetical protein
MSMNRETVTSKKYVQLLAPGAAITDDTGTAYVDLQGFDAVDIVVTYSNVTASAGNNKFDVIVQEASAAPATAGSYTAVAAANLRGSFPVLQNGVTANVASVGVVGSKRYLRVLLDETGTASVIASVMAVLTLSDRDPANAKTVTTGAVT